MRGFLIAIVLGLTALTFYSALWFKSEAIERDITERVTENLNKAGAKDIGIDVDGRHVTLSGIVYDEQVEAAHLDTADKTHGALGPIDGLTYLPDGGYVSASKTEDGIVLRGTVPDEDTRAALVAAAADATDGEVDDQLMISGPVAAWQDEASFGVGQLAGLTTGSMTAATGAFALSGVTDVNADAVRDAVSDRDGWQAFVSTPNVTDDLSAEVARLNGDVAERNDTIAGLQAEVADLNTSAAGLTEERDALAIELDALRASMTEGQTDTASLREQLAAAVADVDTANGVIAERDATIAELRNQVTDLDGVVANLNTEAEGLNGRIAQLETDLANRQVDLGSTDEQVSALSQTVSDLNADLAGRDTAIANLSAVVAERDETIASLNEAAADSQEKVATLESEVTARAAEIASLTGIVVARNESMASMDQTVADAQAKITALEGEVTTREATIDENQTQIAALQNVVQERDATIEALQSRTPSTASSAAQCAEQASAVLEGSQINFDTATATIEEGSVELLERMTGIALACVGEDLTVEIGGHTDNQGSESNNQALSEARAQAVLAFMAERGVPTNGLRAVGYGEGQPIADNATAEGRAQNRRISFEWQAR